MANGCVKHRMPDGTTMAGPPHGQGQSCIEWSSSGGNSMGGSYRKGGRPKPHQKSAGGMLVGPEHEAGGISAIVDGVEPIELEGGEYIINAKTVEAVGESFLHKLNSTSTPYHTGGYDQGQLPGPSQYGGGGKVRRNTMRRGGRTRPVPRGRSKQMARGGVARSTPAAARGGSRRPAVRGRGRTMAAGGRIVNTTLGRKKFSSGGSTCLGGNLVHGICQRVTNMSNGRLSAPVNGKCRAGLTKLVDGGCMDPRPSSKGM